MKRSSLPMPPTSSRARPPCRPERDEPVREPRRYFICSKMNYARGGAHGRGAVMNHTTRTAFAIVAILGTFVGLNSLARAQYGPGSAPMYPGMDSRRLNLGQFIPLPRPPRSNMYMPGSMP